MSVITELIRAEESGKISFGNYELGVKSKLDGFEHNGDLYKVKTFKEITKLERNGMFVYESVPGTVVHDMLITESGVSFDVEGTDDAQITLELEEEAEYKVFIDEANVGSIKTNLGGKLSLSVELNKDQLVNVKIKKC